jgi:hypothetical protein
MMTVPIMQTVWSDRRLFFFMMGLTFLSLAIVIFMLPKRATVRSAIEIGVINQKLEPLEPPEQVARKIPSLYGPAALLVMGKKGTPPSVLSALQNPNVESIGRFVVMVSTIDPSLENEAKEFQEITADLIIKEQAPRAQTLRASIAAQIASLSEISANLQQQVKDDVHELERLGALTDDLRDQIEKQRANLAELYQRSGTALHSSENVGVENQIRGLREQISSQTNFLSSLGLERSRLTRDLPFTRRLAETQAKAIADARIEQNTLSETRVSLPPALMPATTTLMSRRLGLLLVAFVISVLVGLGTVILRHHNA